MWCAIIESCLVSSLISIDNVLFSFNFNNVSTQATRPATFLIRYWNIIHSFLLFASLIGLFRTFCFDWCSRFWLAGDKAKLGKKFIVSTDVLQPYSFIIR